MVTDIEKAAKFYTEAIGFKELKGFDVPADFAADAALIAEMYRARGRIAATVTPRMIRRSDNRVDLAFEITEGRVVDWVIAPDLPGFGKSRHLESPDRIEGYASAVLEALDRLGVQRFHLLGHSMGAIVSLVLAGALPDRVTHLGLIDGVIPPTDKGDNAAERMGMALQAQLDLQGKRKPVYGSIDQAVQVRMKGLVAVSRERVMQPGMIFKRPIRASRARSPTSASTWARHWMRTGWPPPRICRARSSSCAFAAVQG